MGQMQDRLKAAMGTMDPEAMMKAWMPGGAMWTGFGDHKKK
jgi:hypothetical protein